MKREGDNLGVTFTGSVIFNGPMFDIHDNQHVHVNVNKQPEQGEDKELDTPHSSGNNDDEETLVAKLKPIFYNNEENVYQFLKEIRGMATEDITDLVNRWVKDKLISDYGNSRKGKLWGILHEAGLYTKTKSNWNGRVN